EPGGALWRTTLTPEGPGLERIAVERANGTVELSSWGPGAQWLADRLPTLLG
ncbi:MAG TPA: 3-methyladenine DNA glycosylase, partial [Actinobacteria bacterium]|nr:3-methyladenine DNA glycosylase [Actinomycetota bacterium]